MGNALVELGGPVKLQMPPLKGQLLKWIGNKQRFAHDIIRYFPSEFGRYFEPFVGSGGVLGSLAPRQGVASDALAPLIGIWEMLRRDPDCVKRWYSDRWGVFRAHPRPSGYEAIKACYNASPNPADLVFLSRACYGGVVRFRQDGYMSTPCGIHEPISPESFSRRVDVWSERVSGTEFRCADFEEVMDSSLPGDLVYCDPPYSHTQAILYGAQKFSLPRLFETIMRCKTRGVYVALSIDGSKKSGQQQCRLPIPCGLFENEVMVNCGRSMLRRFQREGESLSDEVVLDRLLLTW